MRRNMASLMKLPVIFVCENNFYRMSTPVEKSTAVRRRLQNALWRMGFRQRRLTGTTCLRSPRQRDEAARRARSGGRPTLIEVVTYRWLGHSKSDKRVYRTREGRERMERTVPNQAVLRIFM